MIQWIGIVIIVFQEVEDTQTQHFECDAHVSVVIEPVQHPDTQMLPFWILFCQSFQDIDLQFGCLTVFVHIFDDFEGNFVIASGGGGDAGRGLIGSHRSPPDS